MPRMAGPVPSQDDQKVLETPYGHCDGFALTLAGKLEVRAQCSKFVCKLRSVICESSKRDPTITILNVLVTYSIGEIIYCPAVLTIGAGPAADGSAGAIASET